MKFDLAFDFLIQNLLKKEKIENRINDEKLALAWMNNLLIQLPKEYQLACAINIK